MTTTCITKKEASIEEIANTLMDDIEQIRNKIEAYRKQFTECNSADLALYSADSYLKEAQLVLEDMELTNYYRKM